MNTDPALIKAATRAIMTANEWSSFWDEHDAEQLAKAVLAAIAPRIEAETLEKAAKVAETFAGVHRYHHVAMAIRDLIPATPAKEGES